jgi:hypothetical protein
LTGLLCFAVYVGCALPALYWLDSSELAAAGFALGIAHPPGHPLAALWFKLFTLVPLGPIGFRVAVSQAVAGAVAVAATGAMTQGIVAHLGLPRSAARLSAAAAAVLFGLAWGHAFQSVRPEVYALHAALALGAAALALEMLLAGSPRALAAAALLVGLGLGNHHLLAIAGALPILGLAVARHVRMGARGFALALTVGALALGVYLYLPVRALRHPLVDWGDPRTAGRFFWLVSAQAFQKAVHKAELGPLHFEAMIELGPLAAVAALGGVCALLALPRTRTVGWFLVAQLVLYVAATSMVGFEPENPDRRGYFACAMAYAAVAAAVLPAVLAQQVRDRHPRVAAVVLGGFALALAVPQLGRGIARFSLASDYGAERVLAEALDEAPARARLSSDYFQTLFGLWYLRAAEGARPDVELVQPQVAAQDDRLLSAPAVDDPARPAVLEYGLHMDAARASRLEPMGLLYREDAGATPAALARQDEVWDRLISRLGAQAAERQTRNYLLWTMYLAAQLRCRTGHRQAGLAAAARASVLNGGDTAELSELRARCAP